MRMGSGGRRNRVERGRVPATARGQGVWVEVGCQKKERKREIEETVKHTNKER